MEARIAFSPLGHRVAFVSAVISNASVNQHCVGFVDPSADTGLAAGQTHFTFIERSLTLVHDAFTIVSRQARDLVCAVDAAGGSHRVKL